LGDGCIFLKDNFPDAQISGADFSAYAINKAKTKTDRVNFLYLDVLKDNLPGVFDYIILASTVEHFNHPFFVVDKCLKNINKALFIFAPYTRNIDNPRLYARGQHRYLFNKHTFSQYKCEVLKITELIRETGYCYILYKILP
jgi:2-polyprenyl-3-methyl-5-hydroxy-6-metoxy-1,4-benzoquinol methylase